MKYPLTEDERMIQKTARDFARRELAPVAIEANEKGIFPEGIFRRLGELGFMGVTVPEEYGGVNLGTFSLVLVLEEINAVCASTGVTMSVHNSLTNWCILKYGSEKIRKRFLPRLASGEMLGAYAITESEAGSDVSAMRLSAVRKGNEYVLNGAKIFISTGDKAGAIIVFARTDPGDRTKGISAFVVEPGSPGFSIGKIEKKMGLRASTTVELVFEDCRVSADNLLGTEGMGMKIALAGLDGGRIGIAAQAVGIAQAALDEGRALLARAKAIQHENRRFPIDPVEDRRHGDGRRGGEASHVPRGEAQGRRRAVLEGGGHGEALREPHGEQGRLRRPPDARRSRLHRGIPHRTAVPGRPRDRALRGNERDSAPRHLEGGHR